MVKVDNNFSNDGGNNSTYSKNTNPNKKAIHIHGRMEHNLAGYAKYYSCGGIKILAGNEFIRKIDYNRKQFWTLVSRC
jgi:hypothetical protein